MEFTWLLSDGTETQERYGYCAFGILLNKPELIAPAFEDGTILIRIPQKGHVHIIKGKEAPTVAQRDALEKFIGENTIELKITRYDTPEQYIFDNTKAGLLYLLDPIAYYVAVQYNEI